MNAPSSGTPHRSVARKQRDSLLRRWDGSMTAELERVPAGGGLGQVPARLAPTATADLICGFCATGCSLRAHLREDRAINLTPNPDYPVNLGMACPKGWEALTPLTAADRAVTPLIRDARGELRAGTWPEATDLFVRRFRHILETHGPDSVAFLSTGQICTEEMALLGAFFKFGMGGLHGDSNTRQCMATSHIAYKQSFGFDAPPYTYGDFEASDVLVFVGSNVCIAHPIMWQRVLRNPNHPAILVLDPRKTETAMAATQHLPLRPKSDLVLLYGLAHLIIESGRHDAEFLAAHTTGFEAFREFIRPFTPDRVAAETGLTVGEIVRAAETIGRGRAVSFWWTMGVNQGHEAVRTAQAIINLALTTGNIGRPGTGPNSITGQCNAMGSRLFSNTASLLGGRSFDDRAHRADVARILRIPEEVIPAQGSLAYDQIVDGVASGRIRGLWIIATNGAHSWIDQRAFAEGLGRLDFLVVQDMYTTTATARHAHLVLPAAGWGEKEGTFINSERRIGVVRKVARAPGEALSDFAIFRLLAHAWGCGELFSDWQTPENAFAILKELSRGQPCDITGIHDYAHLETAGGIQWPWSELDSSSTVSGPNVGIAPPISNGNYPDIPPLPLPERRLFADGRFPTSDGRARFHFESPNPPPEQVDDAYPFILLTGRGTSAQWHTQTRTGKSAILRQLHPATCYVEIHPGDAGRLRIEPNGWVRVESRRGSLFATAFVAATVQPGQIFVPMHYEQVNRLTYPVFDPYSRQPGYKYCAVRIRPATPQEARFARRCEESLEKAAAPSARPSPDPQPRTRRELNPGTPDPQRV